MSAPTEFDGKVVVISGAGSGIGRASAELLAARGATVAVADIDLDAAERSAAGIVAAGGSARAFSVDVADAASVERLVADCLATLGGLHGAVNNAAIPGPRVPFQDYPLDDWRKVIDVDLNGVFYAMKYEIAAMRRGGGGAIVNICSMAGAIGIANTGPYSAAKHAVLGMTRTAALEVAEQNIRINAVGPGYVETPFIMSRPPEIIEGYRKRHPMGRMAQVGEIAELVAFLLSEKASFTTGALYLADGGYTVQ